MSKKHTDEFKREAVQLALSSGLSRAQVAEDLGVGKSTLGKWIMAYRQTGELTEAKDDLHKELARLRKEKRYIALFFTLHPYLLYSVMAIFYSNLF